MAFVSRNNFAVYNEINPFRVEWLKNLIAAGEIAPGMVDSRDLWDVAPDDYNEFRQVHLFAGIGVWSYALRRAGWEDTRRVITASCPCQPFSEGGKKRGFADERHLWPAAFHIIEHRKSSPVFGEQVANGDGLAWLDLVQTDMEGADYTFEAFDLCAAGFGAPHRRQRLWFFAYADDCKRGPEDPARDERFRQDADRLKSDGHAGTRRLSSAWANGEFRACDDGVRRPIEPGLSALAHVDTLDLAERSAYGDAIVAEVAVQWIDACTAYLDGADAGDVAEL